MSPHRLTLIALSSFALALASREVFGLLPQGVAVPAWKLSWILFCFGGLWIAYRMNPRSALAELGLTASPVRGLGVGWLATLPMLVVLLLASNNTFQFNPRAMFSSVLLAAVTEEILFRGYLFRQLYRRAGWRFVPAVLLTGAVFGVAHVGTALRGGTFEVLAVVGITTLGGAFFSWLFLRWNDNLWVPIGMHLFMNAWWDMFAVSPNAVGNWTANCARVLAIALAIFMTRRFTTNPKTGTER